MRQEDQKTQYIIIKQINTSTGPTSMMDPESEAILVGYLASEIEPICLGGKRLINWIVLSKNVPEPPIFVGTLEQLYQLVHKFFHFAHLKSTFSILYTYFYETPTSVCLFYTFIQIKYSFLYPHSHRPTPVSHRNPHNPPATNPANQKNKPSNPESTQPNNTIHTIQQPRIETNPTTQSTQPTQNRRLVLSNKISASSGDGKNEKQDRRLQRQAVVMARNIQPETH